MSEVAKLQNNVYRLSLSFNQVHAAEPIFRTQQ